MECVRCGAPLPDHVRFCGKCGAPADRQAAPVVAPATARVYRSRTKKRKNRAKEYVLVRKRPVRPAQRVAGVMLMLAAVGLLLYSEGGLWGNLWLRTMLGLERTPGLSGFAVAMAVVHCVGALCMAIGGVRCTVWGRGGRFAYAGFGLCLLGLVLFVIIGTDPFVFAFFTRPWMLLWYGFLLLSVAGLVLRTTKTEAASDNK